MIRAEEVDHGCYALDAEWTPEELAYLRVNADYAEVTLRGEWIGSLFVWEDTAMAAEVGRSCPYIIIDSEMLHLHDLTERVSADLSPYEQCWDLLHEWLCFTKEPVNTSDVLRRMKEIEDEIVGEASE